MNFSNFMFFAAAAVAGGETCKDLKSTCFSHVAAGSCKHSDPYNQMWMDENCKKSCGHCTEEREVEEGEVIFEDEEEVIDGVGEVSEEEEEVFEDEVEVLEEVSEEESEIEEPDVVAGQDDAEEDTEEKTEETETEEAEENVEEEVVIEETEEPETEEPHEEVSADEVSADEADEVDEADEGNKQKKEPKETRKEKGTKGNKKGKGEAKSSATTSRLFTVAVLLLAA